MRKWVFFFFFQAEDGIRDIGVTGVQTCALPIWTVDVVGSPTLRFVGTDRFIGTLGCGSIVGTYRVVRTEVFVVSVQRFGAEECLTAASDQDRLLAQFLDGRSEERRVGKEGRSRGSPDH